MSLTACLSPAAPAGGWRVALWILRVLAAAILAQTLFFKFTAAPESVHIFEQTGLGAPGRIGSGLAELIAVLLLLTPRPWAAASGALLALGVMAGALALHLTVLGVEVQGDGGLLFGLALTVSIVSVLVLVAFRRSLPVIGPRLP